MAANPPLCRCGNPRESCGGRGWYILCTDCQAARDADPAEIERRRIYSLQTPLTCADEWLWYRGPILNKPAVSDDELPLAGKWMVWGEVSDLDDLWQRAVEGLQLGGIEEINGMKCSTARGGPRASPDGKRAMIFYNHTGDKASILRAGLSLRQHLGLTETLFFKTEVQTRGGTAATGQKRNYTFRLPPNSVELS
jgi:hypothetical protein